MNSDPLNLTAPGRRRCPAAHTPGRLGVSQSARRRWASLAPSLAIAMALAAAAAGVWAQGPWLAGTVSEDAGQRSSGMNSARALESRCNKAMLQGTCRAMQSGPSTSAASDRIFVAGTGEVDAATYEQLRRYGDAMCSEVRRACDQNWDGANCRVARALYPEKS